MLNNTFIGNDVILYEDFDSDLERNQYVLREYNSNTQKDEIFFFDGTQRLLISTNEQKYNLIPRLSNGQVAWLTNDNNRPHYTDGSEIIFYDGSRTIQLTNNTNENANNDILEIQNGRVLWKQYQNTGSPQTEIFLYNGSESIQITNNQVDKRQAKFYGSQIVWDEQDSADRGGDYEIILYNNGQSQRLTDNQTDELLRTVEGNYVIWTNYNPNTSINNLFVYDGSNVVQLTENGLGSNQLYDDAFDIDGQNIVWITNNNIYLYDGYTTRQITNDETLKSSVQISGNRIVWFGQNSTATNPELFLSDGSTVTQITNNNLYKTNLLIDDENIVWQSKINNPNYYDENYNIYIYRNGAISPIVATPQNEKVISLEGNKLLWAIDPVNSYYLSVDQLLIATWTDDTFPILEHPDQYGASYPDLIEAYGYNLNAFNQHYHDFGFAEGRSIDKFDEFEYLASNPDLINAYGADGTAATRHYIEHGYIERRPLDTFEADQYLASNTDLIYVFRRNPDPDLVGARLHYIESGYNTGRPADTFDELSYLASYPDLIQTFGDDPKAATQHYIQYGFFESRFPNFEASYYLAANTDLIDVQGSDRTLATEHYIKYGYREGRPRGGDFDPIQYLASYRDVYDQFGVNPEAAVDHFVDHGYPEGRAKDTFDEYRYLASNSDLIPIYSSYSIDEPLNNYVNGNEATYHYLNYGIFENRPTTTFDPVAYFNANPDVAAYYNNDLSQASYHYVQYGYFEGRSTV